MCTHSYSHTYITACLVIKFFHYFIFKSSLHSHSIKWCHFLVTPILNDKKNENIRVWHNLIEKIPFALFLQWIMMMMTEIQVFQMFPSWVLKTWLLHWDQSKCVVATSWIKKKHRGKNIAQHWHWIMMENIHILKHVTRCVPINTTLM